MHLELTTVICALLAAATLSRAAPSTAPSIQPTAKGVTFAATFPVRTLDASALHAPNTTRTGRALVARQEFPASVLLCPSTNCEVCDSFDLRSITHDSCFSTVFDAQSVAVSQPSGQGLPFAVEVGPTGCTSLATIPNVNECFNVVGGPFSAFELVP